jgi:hypothetical protein
MFLIKTKLAGSEIPSYLPEMVKKVVFQSCGQINSFLASSNRPLSVSVPPQTSSAQVNSLNASAPQFQVPISHSSPIVVAPAMSPATQIESPSIIQSAKNSRMGSFSNAESSSYTPVDTSFSGEKWLVSSSDKARFDAVFKAWDPTNTGYISGTKG